MTRRNRYILAIELSRQCALPSGVSRKRSASQFSRKSRCVMAHFLDSNLGDHIRAARRSMRLARTPRRRQIKIDERRLRVQEQRSASQAQIWRLLRVLLSRRRTVPSHSGSRGRMDRGPDVVPARGTKHQPHNSLYVQRSLTAPSRPVGPRMALIRVPETSMSARQYEARQIATDRYRRTSRSGPGFAQCSIITPRQA